jgi:hypothetical protein
MLIAPKDNLDTSFGWSWEWFYSFLPPNGGLLDVAQFVENQESVHVDFIA